MNLPLRPLLAGLLVALSPGIADAACSIDESTVHWSFPEDGATDVPTNATFWAIASLGSQPRAWLDGVELTATMRSENAGSFKPPELAPYRNYLLEFETSVEDPSIVQRRISVRFTTGPGPATALTGPITLGDDPDMARASSQPFCREVLFSNGCYGAGQDTELVFDSPERPVVWLTEISSEESSSVHVTAWPGACGGPRVITFKDAVGEHCFELIAIDQVGGERRSGKSCPGGDPNAEPSISFCGTSGAPIVPAALLYLGLAVRRRRSRVR